MNKAKRPHYVDNKLFLQAMIEWKEKCLIAEKEENFLPKNRLEHQMHCRFLAGNTDSGKHLLLLVVQALYI